jgi:hypothetical protein
MNKVKFSELTIGDVFVLNNAEYMRIKDFKVSCCKTVNACLVSNTKETLKVKDSQEVEIYTNE